MTTYTPSMYNCAICGGVGLLVRVSAHDGQAEHVDALECVRVLASKLAQAQEDIRALEYRLNWAGIENK